MKKILGLDLGTNSIGWALIEEENGLLQKINAIGSRIIPEKDEHRDFEKGRDISKNATRRQKRSARKANERYKQRRNNIIRLLKTLNIVPSRLDPLFDKVRIEGNKVIAPQAAYKKGDNQYKPHELYKLRNDALTQPVSIEELFRLVYHFNQRRGFKSNKKANNPDEQTAIAEEDSDKIKPELTIEKVKIVSVESTGERKGKLKKEELKVVLEDGRTAFTDKFLFKKFKGESTFLEIKKEITKSSSEPKYTFSFPTKWQRNRKELNDGIIKSGGYPGKYFYEEYLKAVAENKPYDFKVRENVVNRELFVKEFEAIWEKQTEFLKERITNHPKFGEALDIILPAHSKDEKAKWLEKGLGAFIAEYIIFYQRDLKSQVETISDCRFEKRFFKKVDTETGEVETLRDGPKCCAKSNPKFQEFRIWQQINNLIAYNDREEEISISDEVKTDLFAHLNEKENIEPDELKKWIRKKVKGVEEINAVKMWSGNRTMHFLKGIFKRGNYDAKHILENEETYLRLWHLLYSVGDEKGIKGGLKKIDANLPQEIINVFCAVDFKEKQYASLSLKAICNLVPLMRCGSLFKEADVTAKAKKRIELFLKGELDNEFDPKTLTRLKQRKTVNDFKGLSYFETASLVYGKHTAEAKKQFDVPGEIHPVPRHSLRNPVVEQIVNETLMLVKDIWTEYPELRNGEIRIELARELKSNKEQRERTSKAQDASKDYNKEITEEIRRHKGASYNPPLNEIEKVKLWKEANCQSPYTGKTLNITEVLSSYTNIEHIIPKARFYNDGLINKTICESHINDDKDKMTAYEYMNTGTKCQSEKLSYDEFLATIKRFPPAKRRMFTMQEIPNDFIERQKKDTQFIATRIREELGQVVGLNNVKTTTGQVTDYLKEQWGLAELIKRLIKPRFEALQDRYKIELIKEVPVIGKDDKPTGKNRTVIKGYSKRFDHRHHAIDALIVACTKQGIIQQLNLLNQITSGKIKSMAETKGGSLRKFIPPTGSSDPDATKFYSIAEEAVNNIVISYKNKKRLATKRINSVQKFSEEQNAIIKFKHPEQKSSWNIKGKLHDDQPFGKVYFKKREIPVEDSFERLKDIVDDKIKFAIAGRIEEFKNAATSTKDKSKAVSLAKKSVDVRPIIIKEKIEWVEVKEEKFLFVKNRKIYDAEALQKTLSISQLKRIVNKEAREDIFKHLAKAEYEGKTEKAFGPDGFVEFNHNREAAKKAPIYTVRVIEEGDEESVGKTPLYTPERKLDVEKGGNFCVAVYEHLETKDRKFDVVSFFDAVHLKTSGQNPFQTEAGVELEKAGYQMIFTLTHFDLVYVPYPDEKKEDIPLNKNDKRYSAFWFDKGKQRLKRIYRVVKFSGTDFYFQPHTYSTEITIHDGKAKSAKEYQGEFGKGTNGTAYIIGTDSNPIKKACFKISVNKLGAITLL